MPFYNATIEHLGRPMKKTDREIKTPFRVFIKNRVSIFDERYPKKMQEVDEIINENGTGEYLIIWAKTKAEAKEKAEIINKEKYNLTWDGYGGTFRTPHNEQFLGLGYYLW